MQSLRTSILSISFRIFLQVQYTARFRVRACSVVRSIKCPTYLYRDVDISAGKHKYQGMLLSKGLSASATAVYYAIPYCVRILNIMRSWSRPPDYSLFFLLLLSSFYSSLEITLIFHHGHLSAFPPKKIFYLTSDLHRYVSATSVSICEEEEPRYAEPHY